MVIASQTSKTWIATTVVRDLDLVPGSYNQSDPLLAAGKVSGSEPQISLHFLSLSLSFMPSFCLSNK